MRKLGFMLAIIALAGLASASAAGASSGTITRALTNSTWTQGSIAGSITWTDCGAAACSWIPEATIQPSLPSYNCPVGQINTWTGSDSDPNVRTVWYGAEQTANGAVGFDMNNALILNGVQGQRLCLVVIETIHIQDPVCIAQAPILGIDPATCPLVARYLSENLASSLLSVAPLPPVAGSPSTPDATPPNTTIGNAKINQSARKVTLRFSSNEPGSTFLCKLDRSSFRSCTSPKTYKHLKPGKHLFRVEARDSTGNLDSTPAVKKFEI